MADDDRQAALNAIDLKGNIVLKEFGDTALLFRPQNNYEPFVVAYGYDKAAGEWSHGSYHTDLGHAFEEANPEIIEDACVRWQRGDIATALGNEEYPATDANVSWILNRSTMGDFHEEMTAKGNSGTYLNPLDTTTNDHMSKIEQVAFKVDAVLAQAGASAAEAGNNLSEAEQSIIQRCVEEAFKQAELRGDGQPPLLQDFYDILKKQPEPDAQIIALRYERFVKGTMSFFNHHSNVSFDNRIIDFNLKELPDNMLVFALINVCEAVRNRMYQNAERNVRTWLYVEEMQSMFAYPTVLRYFSRFANEGRKFGMLLTGITQNASAMLENEAARNIVTNADFLMLLKQSALDRKQWINLLNLSEQEEEFIDESCEPGNGLLIAGPARVPIRGKFPKGNKLYDLFSTNPNDIAERKAREKMFGN